MATSYTFSLSSDFGGNLSASQLMTEIDADAGVTVSCSYINVNGDVVDIWFGSALSGGEQAVLNIVISNHVPYAASISFIQASGEPTVNDDIADGYIVGSVWISTNGNKKYTCVDNTLGAAVWSSPSNDLQISNVGAAGVGVYKNKTSDTFNMKNINGSSKISITDDTGSDEIDIDVVEANIIHQNLSGAGTNTHTQIDTHMASTSNPHGVTKSQVGLGNVTDEAQVPLTQKGANNGVATLDGSGKIPSGQLNVTSMVYQGTWNAITNSPTITSSSGTQGHYYVVSAALSTPGTSIDGISNWAVSDWIIFNGTVWEKADHSDQVSSVAGKQGAVTLDTDDVSEAGNLYYTDGRFDTRLASKSTTNLSEGTNLYYTEARVDANSNVTANNAKVSADGSITTHSDIVITSVADNEVLAYNSGTSKWINQTAAEAGLASSNHTHSATDVTSGTFADVRIAQSNVTQHEGAITIGNLSGYVANEHVDHSTISVSGGIGLSGGGAINANQTLNLDVNSLTADASPDGAADYVVTYDTSATGHKKVLLNNLPGGGGGEINTASNIGIGGVSIVDGKVGSDLQFKSVNVGSNKLSVTDDTGNNNIDLDVIEANIDIMNLSGSPAGTVVGTTDTQTLTNKTLTTAILTTPQINDTSADHQYIFGVSELTLDRTVTLPLLTGDDTFVFESHTQTLTNKTISNASNTVGANELRTTGASVVIDTAAPPTTGQVLQATSATAATWQTPSGGGGETKFAVIRDEKTVGTNGQYIIAGFWVARTLNTLTGNAGSDVTLSSNQFTLVAGKYKVHVTAPAYDTNNHQCRLRNITDDTYIYGQSARAHSSTQAQSQTNSTIDVYIYITASKTYSIQHRFQNSSVGGNACGWSTEVYTQINITKLD